MSWKKFQILNINNKLQDGPKSVTLLTILRFTLFWCKSKLEVCSKTKTNKEITKSQNKMLETFKSKLKTSSRHSKRKRKLTGTEDLVPSLKIGNTSVARFKCQFLESVWLRKQLKEYSQLQQSSPIATSHLLTFAGLPIAANTLCLWYRPFTLPFEAATTLLKCRKAKGKEKRQGKIGKVMSSNSWNTTISKVWFIYNWANVRKLIWVSQQF